MAFGSDVYIDVPGQSSGALAASEIRSAVEAGLSRRLIVQTMTVNAARLLGVDGDRGRIANGMAADIIAVRGNPPGEPHRTAGRGLRDEGRAGGEGALTTAGLSSIQLNKMQVASPLLPPAGLV